MITDDGETTEIYHGSVKLYYDSITEVLHTVSSPKIEEDVIILQFGSFEPVEVSVLKKTTNTSKVDAFLNKEVDDTWTLVARKRQNHQEKKGKGATSTSTTKVFSESLSVNCLLGLDDDVGNCNVKSVDGQLEGSFGAKNLKISAHDVQSVPDSPMVETTSSFGSTSSTPSLTSLPPIKVNVEENQRIGIEGQFSQLGVGGKVDQKQEEGGFMGLSSPPAPAAPVVGTVYSGVPVVVGGDYSNRIFFSDDERSEQGVTAGYRNPVQTPPAPSMVAPGAAYNHPGNPPASKPEMIAGAYRTAAAGTPQLVQITSGQHQQQYVGYSQIHHPSQPIAPTSRATANYAYEFSDPSHAQIYYSQAHAPQLATQYQTMKSSPAVGLHSTSSQLPTEKKINQRISTSPTMKDCKGSETSRKRKIFGEVAFLTSILRWR
ncbi:uncharacterized protein LOC114074714 [Solanum pennellii]|uniref:Uncharacterized protein LOC114074714 n=1 Tax=Solanum pennellii TaxID=28526 RepID=A0ABM1UYE0_SOLPN|nr:uncharacterized protein LOC114074714 [Solanum pennellii]